MRCSLLFLYFFFFKQKTAYEMRISDWSSDVCSSDLQADTLTRLLYSILATESAPASFYTQAADGRLHSAHYDGLPSDFVAAAITGIGDSLRPSAVQTFHVRNPHDADGVCLDSFVRSVERRGGKEWGSTCKCRWGTDP